MCLYNRDDLIHVLLEEGADITVHTDNNESAYDVATFYKHDKIAQMFAHDTPAHRFK